MTGNICRCSNYNRYVEATLAAAGTGSIANNVAKIVLVDAASENPIKPLKTVGHATTRIDARQRVTGKATYTRDVSFPACSTRACCEARIRMRASDLSTFRRRCHAGREGRRSRTKTASSSGAPAPSPAAGSTPKTSRRSPNSAATPSTIRCASWANQWRPSPPSTGTPPKKRCGTLLSNTKFCLSFSIRKKP